MKRIITTQPEHEVAYQEVVALLRRHQKLSAIELVAIAANLLGKLIALQDQRAITPDEVMRIVEHNIEIGNEQALAELQRTEGNA